MDILFITSTRIGDAVLSTGLLHFVARTYPDARVTVVCGPLSASLFEGYPLLERVIALEKARCHGHWLGLWRQVAGRRWDLVVDLRNSAVSRLIRARRRFVFGPHIDKTQHKVVQNAAVMGLVGADVPAPRLWFTSAQEEAARGFVPDGGPPVLAVGPAANWIGKMWPADRFIEIVDFLTGPGGFMEGARVAVFAAPGEECFARPVLEAVPPARRIDVIAKGRPGEAAAALARCAFYIGNDSGLMHCAAAAGVPTLGLFGPSWPHIYGPYGDHAAYVSTPKNFDELVDFAGYDPRTLEHTLMGSLSVEAVKEALGGFFAVTRSRRK